MNILSDRHSVDHLTRDEQQAVDQYVRTGDLATAAWAWLGQEDDDEHIDDCPKAVARLQAVLDRECLIY